MPTPKINVGAYGSFLNQTDIAGKAKETSEDILTEIDERKAKRDAEREKVYQREEAFYVANDIPDAGLGYETGLEDVYRNQKTEMAAIAAKGHKASTEERAKLRMFTNQIGKISTSQNYLKQIVSDYNTQMNEKGAISSSTPRDIASLLKDLSNGGGDFKPVQQDDGTIRLVGTTSDGHEVDYSYDQLSTIKFSPKYDLHNSAESDRDQIGKVVREIGVKTYTNTPNLIEGRLNEIASARLNNQHDLYEIGAELGYDADYRQANPDTFETDVLKAYKEYLRGGIDTSITEDEVSSTSGSGSGAGTVNIVGDYQHYGTQIRQGDTGFLNTSLRTSLDDPNVQTKFKGDKNNIVEVTSQVTDMSSARLALGKGSIITLPNGDTITSENIGDYDDESIVGGTYTIGEYNVNTDAGNSALFQLYEEGRGFTGKDYGQAIRQLSAIQGGLGIAQPEQQSIDVNKAVFEVPKGVGTTEASKFRKLVTTNTGKGNTGAVIFAKSFQDLTGELPLFLAGKDGNVDKKFKVTNRRPTKAMTEAIKTALTKVNEQKGTNYTMEDFLAITRGEKPASKVDLNKYRN